LAQANAQLEAAASGFARREERLLTGPTLDTVDLSMQILTTVDQIQQNLIDLDKA
jgi:hypothetical protein